MYYFFTKNNYILYSLDDSLYYSNRIYIYTVAQQEIIKGEWQLK